MKRRFVTLDVFTDRRFAGNPVAIVVESEGLGTAAMQAIATEFNLSETVFVRPPEQPAHRARYRIFTPKEEVAFAGHPTIGTAVLLGMLDGGSGPRDMVLEANIGPVPCLVAPTDAGGIQTAGPAEGGGSAAAAGGSRRRAQHRSRRHRRGRVLTGLLLERHRLHLHAGQKPRRRASRCA